MCVDVETRTGDAGVESALTLIRERRRRGSPPEDMLPAVVEDAVVDEVELHASSPPVDDERHVVRLHDLVVPDPRPQRMAVLIVLHPHAGMLDGDPRVRHGEGVERAVVVLPVLVPVPRVRRAGGVAPAAHLQDAEEEQRVDRRHPGRHGGAARCPGGGAPAGVAEVEGARERAYPGVDPGGALDGEVGHDPVPRGEGPSPAVAVAAEQEVREPGHADDAPRHAEVVEAEVVVAVEPWEVEPVVEHAADAADLEEAHGPQRPPALAVLVVVVGAHPVDVGARGAVERAGE